MDGYRKLMPPSPKDRTSPSQCQSSRSGGSPTCKAFKTREKENTRTKQFMAVCVCLSSLCRVYPNHKNHHPHSSLTLAHACIFLVGPTSQPAAPSVFTWFPSSSTSLSPQYLSHYKRIRTPCCSPLPLQRPFSCFDLVFFILLNKLNIQI